MNKEIKMDKKKKAGYVIWTCDTANFTKGMRYNVDLLNGTIKQVDFKKAIVYKEEKK